MVKIAENILVGISIGDLNGIGSEVVLKTFEDPRMLEFCTPIIFANVKLMSFIKKHFELSLSLHGIDKLDQVIPGKINVLNVWKESVEVHYGQTEAKIGDYAIKSFKAATKALKEDLIDVLITAPISKSNIQSSEFNFPGHTDYLDQELEGDALMLMIHEKLRIGLLTDHIPINEISNQLSESLIINKINVIKKSMIQDFGISKPKIAVLGLNPHSGDGGVIGKEEDTLIKPTLKKMFEKGTLVFGPFSADGFFGSNQYENYDAILAMYHDQGLIPFKTLSFGKGVNYTAGLNKIRTSPDHGTAFEIAGKGTADFNSFKEALYLALDIYNERNQYEELTKNTLKTKEKQL